MNKIIAMTMGLFAFAGVASASSLSGTSWDLQSYNGSDAQGTISFTDTNVSARFCNTLNGSYTQSGSSIVGSGPMASTKMACEPEIMKLDTNFDLTKAATASVSGTTLTVTTHAKNVYTFAQTSTEDTDPVMCTMQYEPVCGEVEVQCVTAPCNPIQQTYGNSCTAGAAGATIIHEGECKDPVVVGGDVDEYGCKASAGYSWNQDLLECVKPWEQATLVKWANMLDMTKYTTVSDFQYNSPITREQAAKMIVAAIDASGADEWMVKQVAGSCEWTDADQIDSTLREYLDRACRLALIKGFDGKVMPQQVLTDTDMMTIITRAGQFIPALGEYLSLADLAQTHNKPISRGEVITLLYSIVDEIRVRSVPATPVMDYDQLQKDLDEAKGLWSGAKLSQYTIIQQRSCFCMQDYIRPMMYNVVSGAVTTGSAVYADDKTKIAIEAQFNTVEDAFAMIQDAIDNKVDSLTVEYDSTTGYPITITIDRSFQMADEEQYMSFKIIGKDDVLLSGEYELTSYNNKSVSTGITLSFTANRISMKACNSVGGEYTASDKAITFGPMVSTQMYCMDEQLMNIENILGSLTQASYVQNSTSLTFSTGATTLVWTKK